MASSCLDDCCTLALHVDKYLTRLCRADDASALDALERDSVQSAPELNVALAYRASAGEYRSLLHIACLRVVGFPGETMVVFGLNQKAPILDRGFGWE